MFDNRNNYLKGNWYNFKISCTDKSYKLIRDPIGCTITRTCVIKFPRGYHVLDVMPDVTNIKKSDTGISIKYLDDNTQGISLPDKGSCTDIELNVFANVRCVE